MTTLGMDDLTAALASSVLGNVPNQGDSPLVETPRRQRHTSSGAGHLMGASSPFSESERSVQSETSESSQGTTRGTPEKAFAVKRQSRRHKAAPSHMMPLLIHGPGHMMMNVKCNARWTVYELKEAIATENAEYPADNQRLVCAGRLLQDSRSIRSYGILPNFTIHLLRGLKGYKNAVEIEEENQHRRAEESRRIQEQLQEQLQAQAQLEIDRMMAQSAEIARWARGLFGDSDELPSPGNPAISNLPSPSVFPGHAVGDMGPTSRLPSQNWPSNVVAHGSRGMPGAYFSESVSDIDPRSTDGHYLSAEPSAGVQRPAYDLRSLNRPGSMIGSALQTFASQRHPLLAFVQTPSLPLDFDAIADPSIRTLLQNMQFLRQCLAQGLAAVTDELPDEIFLDIDSVMFVSQAMMHRHHSRINQVAQRIPELVILAHWFSPWYVLTEQTAEDYSRLQVLSISPESPDAHIVYENYLLNLGAALADGTRPSATSPIRRLHDAYADGNYFPLLPTSSRPRYSRTRARRAIPADPIAQQDSQPGTTTVASAITPGLDGVEMLPELSQTSSVDRFGEDMHELPQANVAFASGGLESSDGAFSAESFGSPDNDGAAAQHASSLEYLALAADASLAPYAAPVHTLGSAAYAPLPIQPVEAQGELSGDETFLAGAPVTAAARPDALPYVVASQDVWPLLVPVRAPRQHTPSPTHVSSPTHASGGDRSLRLPAQLRPTSVVPPARNLERATPMRATLSDQDARIQRASRDARVDSVPQRAPTRQSSGVGRRERRQRHARDMDPFDANVIRQATETYAGEIIHLSEMGFTNLLANLRALILARGNVSRATEFLLRENV